MCVGYTHTRHGLDIGPHFSTPTRVIRSLRRFREKNIAGACCSVFCVVVAREGDAARAWRGIHGATRGDMRGDARARADV